MAYTPQTWVDNNASYPLSAARMNTMESGISSAASVADQGHRILTTIQRGARTGVTAGTMIYNTTAQQMQIYIGTGWIPIGAPLVFTNEAARDAAITSPSEGMIAYITTPTIPAATGGTTLLPSGIETVYNGFVWVCRTPVCAVTNNAGTTASTSFTATLGGSPGTNPSVTLVTGTTALLQYYCEMSAGASSYAYISVAVSGAGTVAAAEGHGSATNATTQTPGGRTIILGGLTAGTNTFTLQYKTNNATCSWVSRTLSVTGVA